MGYLKVTTIKPDLFHAFVARERGVGSHRRFNILLSAYCWSLIWCFPVGKILSARGPFTFLFFVTTTSAYFPLGKVFITGFGRNFTSVLDFVYCKVAQDSNYTGNVPL